MEKRCIIPGCDAEGSPRTGICKTCRLYLKRAGARTLGWRLARRETIARWDARLQRLIPRSKS